MKLERARERERESLAREAMRTWAVTAREGGESKSEGEGLAVSKGGQRGPDSVMGPWSVDSVLSPRLSSVLLHLLLVGVPV